MTEFQMILARKIIKKTEIFITFARKVHKKSRILHDFCPKNIFHEFWGACAPPSPVS